MDRPIYFAWVGGPLIPAFELVTTGDTWGGSTTVIGAVWGGRLNAIGDLVDDRLTLTGASQANLRSGHSYLMQRPGLPDSTVVYLGGSIATSGPQAIATSLTLVNEDDRSQIILASAAGLDVGATYAISGSGIPQGATFLFDGNPVITISLPATETGVVPVQISRPIGRDGINNLGDVGGLVEGQAYDVFGTGIPTGAGALWDGASGLTLTAEATATGFGTPILVSKAASYPDGGAFDPDLHARVDEEIVSLQITQTEGDFATMSVVVKNPGVGLLGSARNLWAWVSWFDGSAVVPLFHGRLVGVPQALQGESVTLNFIARPEDYEAQKEALAASLRVMPYWDPVWLSENAADPDTVMEARTQAWHPDRLTLALTASDLVTGEDGTLVVTEDDHLYDRLAASYSAPPLRRVNVRGTVTWTQVGGGDLDLTPALWKAFKDVSESSGSVLQSGIQLGYPIIATFTGDGFKSAWPAPGTSIGGGWSVGDLASLTEATWVKAARYAVRYQGKNPNAQPQQLQIPTPFNAANPGAHILTTFSDVTLPSSADRVLNSTLTYDVLFDLSSFKSYLPVHYAAERSRSETLAFSLEADVQSIMTEAGVAENETIELSSAFIDQPVDPGGALPIGDLRRNAYFPTDRGILSFEFLLLLARAKLIARARAVTVKFVTTWAIAQSLTCRWNVELHDRRLPGGSVTGKVTGLVLAASGSGEFAAEVTIACTVGHGNVVEAVAGAGVWADDYVDPGYQQEMGGQIELVASELVYQAIDNIAVIDDDGVDFFNPQKQVYPPSVVGGLAQQKAAIDAVSTVFTPGFPPEKIISNNSDGSLTIPTGTSLFPGQVFPVTPVEALALNPTRVSLNMVPMTGGAFQSNFYVLTEKLAVSKTLDLEAS